MSNTYGPSDKVFWQAVLVGAYVGVVLQVAVAFWYEPVEIAELWVTPFLLLLYGLFAVPFVAFGLALFGLPVTRLLQRSSQDWWVGLVAAVWGCIAGKLMFYALDHLLFFGLYEIMEVSMIDMGILYGLPTGLAYWALHRRELAKR